LIVAQNVANLYAGPDTGSGLVSQALMGDLVTVAAEQNGFSHVTTADRYTGWIDSGRLVSVTDYSDYLQTTIATLFADIYTAPDAHSEIITKLVVGTRTVIARQAESGDWVPLRLPDSIVGYVHRVSLMLTEGSAAESLRNSTQSSLRRQDIVSAIGRLVAETAKRLVGTPYLWGGCTPFGMDCSGLTQLAYKLNGIQLLRDANVQFVDRRFVRVKEGQSLETVIFDEGDLVVFSRRDDKQPTHIGIALGDGRFLHARGGQGVRFDFCDSEEYGKYYIGAIRLSADADFAIQAA